LCVDSISLVIIYPRHPRLCLALDDYCNLQHLAILLIDDQQNSSSKQQQHFLAKIHIKYHH